ncbi:MAG: Replicase polyprotein 1ab [Cryptosporangiaceae bacterium]|nr:Replicase polyprotein 1ab [Cryptosporangiaceae bacterium]
MAKHLVAAGRLVDEDPQAALAHAYAARAHAARIGAVREAVGVTAYHAGEWAVALSELRAVRRMNGSVEHLAVEADCERALGRPDRALELERSPIASRLDEAGRVELLIVASGARRDLGQLDSAVVMLQVPELEALPPREWSGRLGYAYADALLAAGRTDEARAWFERVQEIDPYNDTGAGDRLLELDGIVLDDAFDQEPEDEDPVAEVVDEAVVDVDVDVDVDEAVVDVAEVADGAAGGDVAVEEAAGGERAVDEVAEVFAAAPIVADEDDSEPELVDGTAAGPVPVTFSEPGDRSVTEHDAPPVSELHESVDRDATTVDDAEATPEPPTGEPQT